MRGFGAWVLKYYTHLLLYQLKLSQDYIKNWYIDIIFYMQNSSQIYNLITTVNRYYYTGKLELPRLYVLVHLRLIHSHSHLVWLSKSCVRSLCVMSELVCPNLKVLVTTLMVSPIGINNHVICLWSFLFHSLMPGKKKKPSSCKYKAQQLDSHEKTRQSNLLMKIIERLPFSKAW